MELLNLDKSVKVLHFVLLQTEIPSGMCAKLRTVAASNNRDHARNLSSRTLVVTFNRSHRQSYHIALSLTIACSRHIYVWCCSSRTSRSW